MNSVLSGHRVMGKMRAGGRGNVVEAVPGIFEEGGQSLKAPLLRT